ncbi:MAG: RDD family protein [Planctomycetota bacterium]
MMSSRVAIDLTAKVITPENIQFEYRIAGPFRRLPAFFSDLVIRAGILIAVSIAIGCSGILQSLAIPASLGLVAVTLSYFILDWFYGLIFETYWNGKTPGKWLAKIQVISADGRPISAYQARLRNFLRGADLAPFLSLQVFDASFPPAYVIPTGLVAFFCMAFTSRYQRLGDLAAGTMVIVDERAWIPPAVKFEDARVESLAAYIPPNFRMTRTMGRAVALYVERRGRIAVSRRRELASILATPLMEQFGFRDDTSPDLFLCSLYYREFVLKQVTAPGEGGASPTSARSSSYGSPLQRAESYVSTATAPPVLGPVPTPNSAGGSE